MNLLAVIILVMI